MTPTTLTAVFDGHHLIPEGPCDLKPAARYRLQVELELPCEQDAAPWKVIESLIGSVPGQDDWASQHDHYIYGLPKRTEGQP